MLQQTTYLQGAGATFLALINDLKRNEAAAASFLLRSLMRARNVAPALCRYVVC